MRGVVLAFTVVIATGWCLGQTGTVSFLVVDEDGNALGAWKVSSFKDNTHEIASQFAGMTGAQIPNGSYSYVLTGFSLRPNYTPTLGGRIEVLRPETFVVRTATRDILMGAAFDGATPASFVIRGKIEPMPPRVESSDPVRIHLHPLNRWSDVDIKVDPAGDFRIYQALSGHWVLTVIRGTEVLHVEPVLFDQGIHSTSFVLQIGSEPHSVLRVH